MEMGSRGNGGSEVAGLVQHRPTTDEEIVLRVRAGDTEVFEVLMRRHNQRLYCAVRAIVDSDAEAEDAVQQTYLAAYRNLAQFEGRARFRTWITRIAIHEALARRRQTLRSGGQPTSHAFIDRVPAPTPDPERQTYAVELNAVLTSALGRLPAAYRAVFVLREIHGFNTLDTAERLRLSEGTVRTRLHRAKDFLQRTLQELMPPAACRFDGTRCDRLVQAVMGRLGDPDSQIPRAAPLTAISEIQPDRPSEHP
jgi:RNA polymerase sigma-70 factor (ECF subfamily)